LNGVFQSDPKQIKTSADWRFEFEVAQAGRYRVSFSGIAGSSRSDSGFYAFDDAEAKQFTFKIGPEASVRDVGIMTFEAGKHELKFWTRERGIRIVQLNINPAEDAKTLQASNPAQYQDTLERYPFPADLTLQSVLKTPHPVVFFTPEQIAAARARLPQSPELQQYLDGQRGKVDFLLQKSDAELRALIPPPGSDVVTSLGFNLGPDSKPLRWCGWKDPLHVVDSKGVKYPNADFPDDGFGGLTKKKKYHFTARAYGFLLLDLDVNIFPALADCYALTGDRRYAHIAAVLFDQLAPTYAGNEWGPIDWPNHSGRLNNTAYMTSRSMMNFVLCFDMILDSGELAKPSATLPGATIFDNAARNIFWNGALYNLAFVRSENVLSNGDADHFRAPIAVGLMFNRPKLAELFTTPGNGFADFLANSTDRNGLYFESSHMYSSHCFELYRTIADLCESAVRQKWPGWKSYYGDPVLMTGLFRYFDRVEISGRVPETGDIGIGSAADTVGQPEKRFPVVSMAQTQLKNSWLLLALAEDPAVRRNAANFLRNAYGEKTIVPILNRDLLFAVGDREIAAVRQVPLDPEYFETGSTLFGSKGLAILRGGRGVRRHGAQLLFGPQLNHGHYEGLSWTFFDAGSEWSRDPGYFNCHYRFSWTSRSVSHQQMTVNGEDIDVGGGGGFLEAWKSGGPVQFVKASQPNAYPGITRFERLIAQVDAPSGDLAYWLDIGIVQGGKFRDDSFHTVMRDAEYNIKFTPTGKFALGGDMAKGMHFTDDLRLSGYQKEDFYWQLPGFGYGLLLSPATCRTDAAVRGIYRNPVAAELAPLKREIVVDFAAEPEVEYIDTYQMPTAKLPAVRYLLRRGTAPAGTVFAKLVRFQGSPVEKMDTVAAEGLNRAYLVRLAGGAADLWLTGAMRASAPGYPEVTADGKVTVVRFDAAKQPVEIISSGATKVICGGRDLLLGSGDAVGSIKAVEARAFQVEFNRPPVATAGPLVVRGSGLPSTWFAEKISDRRIELADLRTTLCSFRVTPVPDQPQWYSCQPSPGQIRSLNRTAPANLVIGRAATVDGKLLGTVDDAGWVTPMRLNVKLPGPQLPDGTVVTLAEVKAGDRFEVLQNFEWKK